MKKISVSLVTFLITAMSASQAGAQTVDPVLEKAKADFIKTVQSATKSIDGYINMAEDMVDFGKAVDNSQLTSGGKQAIAAFQSAEDKAKAAIAAAKSAPNLAVLQQIVNAFRSAASANASAVQSFVTSYNAALKTSQSKVASSAGDLAAGCSDGASQAQDLVSFAYKVKLTDYERNFAGFAKSFEDCVSKAQQAAKSASKADFGSLAKIADDLSKSADKAEKNGKDLKDRAKYFRNEVEPIVVAGLNGLVQILNAGAEGAEGALATLDPSNSANKSLISFYKKALSDLKKAADGQLAAIKKAKGADLPTLAALGIAADKVILAEGMLAAQVLQPLLVRNAQYGVAVTQKLIDALPPGDLENMVLQLQGSFQALATQATALAADIKNVSKTGVAGAKAVLNSIATISAQLKAYSAALSQLTA